MHEKGEEDMEEEEEGKLMKGDSMKRRKDEGAGAEMQIFIIFWGV